MNGLISGLVSRKTGEKLISKNMKLEFDAQTPEGIIKFRGELSPDEVNYLLKIAIQVLLIQGSMPFTNNSQVSPSSDIIKH